MNYTKIFGVFSILINTLLILIILIKSPNEQSLQENLESFKFFKSSKQAESSINKLIQVLTISYFIIALCYVIQSYF
ncbi:unnamed protein product [Pylaiella littoralis]